ncbi:MAG: SMP-30/gluconolactonase/LRE family protein [Mycobacteriales bacterium]
MLSFLLQGALGLLSLAAGAASLAGLRPVRTLGLERRRARWPWAVPVLLGGLVLLAGLRIPFLTFFGTVLVALPLLLGLAVLGLRRLGRRPGTRAALPATVLLAGVLLVGALQPLGLKVLLLPTADHLPYEPVAAASVVRTYGSGMWFEGISAGPDGTLYLTESKGEDYAHGDKSQVRAELIARRPDGTERVLLRLPKGSTAGVTAVASDGTLYMTGTGGNRGLWRISPDGTARLITRLPHGSFPNGVTLGPDGQVYVADSALGTLWRIDPASGRAERAYSGPELRARRFVALPPGANGVHFFGRDLYVTNSDAGTLLRLPLGTDGRLGRPTTVVRGVPADDFAIDAQGVVYLTTHIYNTIVRVGTDGRRTVVADHRQHVVGATDCVLVSGPGGTQLLYAVTDGGALATGDAKARGTLLQLTLR